MNKPIVGITMGDPAGSGPEITIKALADPEQYSYCRPIVVGDVKVMEQAKKFVGREDIVIHRCEKVSDALFTPGTIDVLHLDLIEDISKFEIAKVSVEGGNAAFQCVKKVIELAMAGEVDATCTNALNKEAMNKALEYYHGEKSDGYTHFDGHTEIYATYTHTKKYTMMLAHHDLRVVHVSTHVSLREACDRVKKDRVLEVIEIANKACKDMGIENTLQIESGYIDPITSGYHIGCTIRLCIHFLSAVSSGMLVHRCTCQFPVQCMEGRHFTRPISDKDSPVSGIVLCLNSFRQGIFNLHTYRLIF
mgnify:CR=1 FL=1